MCNLNFCGTRNFITIMGQENGQEGGNVIEAQTGRRVRRSVYARTCRDAKEKFYGPRKNGKRVKAAEIKRQYMDTLASICGQWMGQKQQGILYLPVKARIFRRWG